MNTDKNTVLQQLRVRENIYVILSGCTRMPFVLCDPETYDDEVFIFFEKDNADREAKKLNEEAQPVQVIKIENKNFLAFYSGLYPMGVNCMFVNCGTENEIKIQLEELVKKPEDQKLPDGVIRIENRPLHLTALYFMQELRRKQHKELTDTLKELQEEMMTHYSEATLIIAMREDKGIVIMKNKEGHVFLPVFTDIQEFRKFQMVNAKEKFGTGMIKAEKIRENLPPEAVGILINPLSVNVPLKIR